MRKQKGPVGSPKDAAPSLGKIKNEAVKSDIRRAGTYVTGQGEPPSLASTMKAARAVYADLKANSGKSLGPSPEAVIEQMAQMYLKNRGQLKPSILGDKRSAGNVKPRSRK